MKQQILQKLENLPYFSKGNLRLFQNNSNYSFDRNIKNWQKKNFIKKLKNGLYVTEKFILQEKNITQYVEMMANLLVYPSYISCEYVLQKNNMLTEAVYGFTSIATKSTRTVENFLGNFRYYNLKKELFTGFQDAPYFYKETKIFIATRAKALFDFIYLKKNRYQNFSPEEIEEMRFNFDEWRRRDMIELKKYIRLSKNRKMENFYKNLCRLLGR